MVSNNSTLLLLVSLVGWALLLAGLAHASVVKWLVSWQLDGLDWPHSCVQKMTYSCLEW